MLDHIIIISYLLITLIIGFLAGKKTKTFSDFAIGKRSMSTFALLAAIMASIVDASETIDYASEVFNQGLIYCFAYLGAGFASLALSFVFAPRFDKFLGNACSTGDIIEQFFGIEAKILIGIATLLETILFCATQILAISITIQYFFGFSGNIGSVIISIITLLYFFRGGARSVNATDIFQFAILIVALPIFCGIALSKIGGYSVIISSIEKSGLNFTSINPASYGKSLTMLILFSLPGQYPLIIQRMLMAKNSIQLRNVLLLDAFIGTLLRITVILIGVSAFILLPNSDSNFALLELANYLLPTGIKGFAVIGLLAIMMSTIDSTIHLGAVAITQDIFGSNKKMDDEKKLQYARYSSLIVIISSIVISLNFEKISILFYLLMALGNCLIWPAIFLGLTGISSSKNGFWISSISGFTSLILLMYISNIDLLYLNLIATSVSLFVHLFYVIKIENKKIKLSYSFSRIKFPQFNMLSKLKSIRIIKNKDYCNIFAVLSIFLSIYPFFITNMPFYETPYILPIISITTGFLSILILFSEFWSVSLVPFYPLIWGILVILALPTQTYFMLINTTYSFVWIMDTILLIPLMKTISTKTSSFLFNIIGIILALVLAWVSNHDYSNLSVNFGYYVVLTHAIILALCFALLRKRDIELCRFEAATIVHETKRVLNTFQSVANFYNRRLPLLIDDFHNQKSSEQTAQLTTKEIDMLLSLPGQIIEMTRRTINLLNNYIGRITSYSMERNFTQICSIKECILEAISDASLSQRIKNALNVDVECDIMVRGDKEQLVQLFINILENAGHATVSVDSPSIYINIMGNTVFITDNGHGINASHLPNIFDEFFSTKSSTGQGLAFCKNVMAEHEGSILCTSKENIFTRFELRFQPASKE